MYEKHFVLTGVILSKDVTDEVVFVLGGVRLLVLIFYHVFMRPLSS
jgi:hypothetical protein